MVQVKIGLINKNSALNGEKLFHISKVINSYVFCLFVDRSKHSLHKAV